jgi:hypothetical protein
MPDTRSAMVAPPPSAGATAALMTPDTPTLEQSALSTAKFLEDCIDDLSPAEIGVAIKKLRECAAALARAQDNERDAERLHWLHSEASNVKDGSGYEWGIYRVKWVNGQATKVWATNSDFSDLDEHIRYANAMYDAARAARGKNSTAA